MHGPPLTPREAVASVARRVRRLEAQDLDRDQAIRRAALETGIDPEKVRRCIETAFPDPAIRLSPPRTQRRDGCPRALPARVPTPAFAG